MTNLSLQLYSVRHELERDPEGTLAAISAMGLTEVEPFGITMFRDWLPAALRANNLKVTSVHCDLLGDFDGTVAAAEELGATLLIQPYYDHEKWTSREDLKVLADQLNEAARKAAEKGYEVGYHNHHFEFVNQVEGRPAYDVLVEMLDPAVKLEVDTYWAILGGQDILALLERLGDRVTHLHIKDGPLDIENDHAANVVLGQGKVDLESLLAGTQDKTWVIEFDETEGDIMEDVGASVLYAMARAQN